VAGTERGNGSGVFIANSPTNLPAQNSSISPSKKLKNRRVSKSRARSARFVERLRPSLEEIFKSDKIDSTQLEKICLKYLNWIKFPLINKFTKCDFLINDSYKIPSANEDADPLYTLPFFGHQKLSELDVRFVYISLICEKFTF
jgi:hypothetical protein